MFQLLRGLQSFFFIYDIASTKWQERRGHMLDGGGTESHYLSVDHSNCHNHTWIKAISTAIMVLSPDYMAFGSLDFNKGC